MKLPNIKILDEKNKILHQKSKEVTFPISKEDRKLAEDTIKEWAWLLYNLGI